MGGAVKRTGMYVLRGGQGWTRGEDLVFEIRKNFPTSEQPEGEPGCLGEERVLCGSWAGEAQATGIFPFLIKKFLLMYFWLLCIFTAFCGLSLVAASGGYCCGERAPHCRSFSYGPPALGPLGLGVLRHVGSSQARDWTHVPCTSRQILNHWTTGEVPAGIFLAGLQKGLRFWKTSYSAGNFI